MKCWGGFKHFSLFLILRSSINLLYANEIAITIDDLPFIGSVNGNAAKYRQEHDRFMKILQTLEQYHIPTTGFVIAGSIESGQRKWLKTFKQAGYELGYHTYSPLY